MADKKVEYELHPRYAKRKELTVPIGTRTVNLMGTDLKVPKSEPDCCGGEDEVWEEVIPAATQADLKAWFDHQEKSAIAKKIVIKA